MGRNKGQRSDAPVKVDREVLNKMRMIAAWRDITLTEYITETLRPIVDRDLTNMSLELRKKIDFKTKLNKKNKS